MDNNYKGAERRRFERCDFEKPIHYREIEPSGDKKTLTSIVKGIVKNLSAAGVLFVLKSTDIPNISNLLLLELEYHTATICREIERQSLITGNKFLGKVVRIVNNFDGTCDIGVALIPNRDGLSKDIKIMIGEEEP